MSQVPVMTQEQHKKRLAEKTFELPEFLIPPFLPCSSDDEMPPLCSSSDSESSEEEKTPKKEEKKEEKEEKNQKEENFRPTAVKKSSPFQPAQSSAPLSILTFQKENSGSKNEEEKQESIQKSSNPLKKTSPPPIQIQKETKEYSEISKMKEETLFPSKSEEKSNEKGNKMPELFISSGSEGEDSKSDMNQSMGSSDDEEMELPALEDSSNSEDIPDLASSSSDDDFAYPQFSINKKYQSGSDTESSESSEDEYRRKPQKKQAMGGNGKPQPPPKKGANNNKKESDDEPPPLISSSGEDEDDNEIPPLVSSSDDEKNQPPSKKPPIPTKKTQAPPSDPKKNQQNPSKPSEPIKSKPEQKVQITEVKNPEIVKEVIKGEEKKPAISQEQDEDEPPPLIASSDEEDQPTKIEKKEEVEMIEKKEAKQEEKKFPSVLEEDDDDIPPPLIASSDEDGPPPLISSSEDEKDATSKVSKEKIEPPKEEKKEEKKEERKEEKKEENDFLSVAPEIAKTFSSMPYIEGLKEKTQVENNLNDKPIKVETPDNYSSEESSEDNGPPPLLSSSSDESPPKKSNEEEKVEEKTEEKEKEEEIKEKEIIEEGEDDDDMPELVGSSGEEEDVFPSVFSREEDDDVPALISSSEDESSAKRSKYEKKEEKMEEKKEEKKEEEKKDEIKLSSHLEDMIDEELIEMDLQIISPAAQLFSQLSIEKSKMDDKKREENVAQAEIYKQTANELMSSEKHTLAIKYYSKAIKYSPFNPIYWANRSAANFKNMNFGFAISDATRAIELDDSYTKAHYRRAVALMELSRHKEAIADLKVVLNENPNSKEAAIKLRTCEEVLKKVAFGKAIAHEKLVENRWRRENSNPKFVLKTINWLENDFPKLGMLSSRVIAKEISKDFEGMKAFLNSIPSDFIPHITPWLPWHIFERYRYLHYQQNSNPSPHLKASTKYQLMKAEEDYYRGLYANDRKHIALKDPFLFLIDVHKNQDLFYLETDDNIDSIPKLCHYSVSARKRYTLLPNSTTNPSDERVENTIVDYPTFLHNFNVFTEGQLKHLDWNNILVAGGSVLASIMPTPLNEDLRQFYHLHAYRSSDIDLFIYGLTVAEANAKLEQIYNEIQMDNKSTNPVMAVRTRHAITLVTEFPQRHIQIILRLYSSPSEILMGFDVDSCAVGFDGVKVWMNPRCARALKYQTNIVDLSRRSPSYENRLWKYAKRGFSISVPGLDWTNIPKIGPIEHFQSGSYKGLKKLLYLDHMQKNWGFTYSHRTMKYDEEKSREIDELKGTEISDYENVHVPYGPTWRTWDIRARLRSINEKVNDWFYRIQRCNPPRAEGMLVVLYGTMQQVINDPLTMLNDVHTTVVEDEAHVSVFKTNNKETMWLVDNPGKQGDGEGMKLLTGSFYPVQEAEEKWMHGSPSVPRVEKKKM